MAKRKTGRGSRPSARSRNVITQARVGDGSRWLWYGAAGVVAAFLVVVVVVTVNSGGDRREDASSTGLEGPPATVAVGALSAPPWPAPRDARAAVKAAGLPMMSSEGSVEHIHAHLDVLVDGQPVAVPADIGVDTSRGTMSPLHTHDASGVIHVEAPAKRQFSLGEFFSEWGVDMSADHIGALRVGDGRALRVFVNGTERTENPAAITFASRDQVSVVFGVPSPGETIPNRYDFAAGE